MERRLQKLDPKDTYFTRFASDNTSQGGEDGILNEVFRILHDNHHITSANMYCVDIGAWDGKHLSNTYTLIQDKGWRGLLIEAESSRFDTLSSFYQSRSDVTCLNCAVDIDGTSSLPCLFDENRVPSDFAFLCIDIDGADYHLWQSLAATQYKPLVVCIEFNPTIPHEVVFINPRDGRIQQGSSIAAMLQLGHSLGYLVFAVTTFNLLFIRNDIPLQSYLPVEEVGCELCQELARIHLPNLTTSFFQLYDGSLRYLGVNKLLWHRKGINVEKLQVLSRKEQYYPFAPSSFLTEQRQRLLQPLLLLLPSAVDDDTCYQQMIQPFLTAFLAPALRELAWQRLQQALHHLLTQQQPRLQLVDMLQRIVHWQLEQGDGRSLEKEEKYRFLQLVLTMIKLLRRQQPHSSRQLSERLYCEVTLYVVKHELSMENIIEAIYLLRSIHCLVSSSKPPSSLASSPLSPSWEVLAKKWQHLWKETQKIMQLNDRVDKGTTESMLVNSKQYSFNMPQEEDDDYGEAENHFPLDEMGREAVDSRANSVAWFKPALVGAVIGMATATVALMMIGRRK